MKDVETTKGSQSNQLRTKADAKVTKRKLVIEFVSDDEEALVKDIEMSKAGQSNQLQYKDDAIDAKRVERKRKRAILYARTSTCINRQPSVITVAQMKTMLTHAQKAHSKRRKKMKSPKKKI